MMVVMTIAQQLEAALTAKGLTLYGAAKLVGAKSDLPLKTVYRRLADMTADNPPLSQQILQETCEALGLTITIKVITSEEEN